MSVFSISYSGSYDCALIQQKYCISSLRKCVKPEVDFRTEQKGGRSVVDICTQKCYSQSHQRTNETAVYKQFLQPYLFQFFPVRSIIWVSIAKIGYFQSNFIPRAKKYKLWLFGTILKHGFSSLISLSWLLESCIPVLFFYRYPPPFFLLKYYCDLISHKW